MAGILSVENYDLLSQSLTIPVSLQALLDAGFREEQGCILLKDYIYFGPGEFSTEYAKTSYEDFLNHANINGHISTDTDDLYDLQIGIEFGKRLYQKLIDTYDKKFRIIVSYEIEITEGPNTKSNSTCIIKFHTIRPESDEKYRKDIIDWASNEGLMFLE